MDILAIIPARGGSKGLPNKNILHLNGHPLVSYSIAAALQTPEITRVICSTDTEQIAQIAREYGAEVPFMRPAHLAEDDSRDFGAFEHALEWLLKTEQYVPDLVVNLRPTSPIRFIQDIQAGIELLRSDIKIDSVRSICSPSTPPYKMWTMNKTKIMTPLLELPYDPEPYNSPRQDLPEVWAQTGALEVIREKTLSVKKSMSGATTAGLIIDTERYSDIDTKNDFVKAEIMLNKMNCIRPE